MQFTRPIIVSFSGIDGAGKSTVIAALESHLRSLNFTVIRREFWDQVAVFSRFRELVSSKAFKGDEGVGSPERPIVRRDKNVSTWYVRLARLFFYVMDALHLRLIVSRSLRGECDFVLFDRYIYDELANLPLQSDLMKMYAMLMLVLAPKPDAAYLLDADPSAACLRKPEYPLEFLRQNRSSFLRLSRLSRQIRVIRTASSEETLAEILQSIGDVHSCSSLVQALNP
jgi:thymidylate kinase